jgi:tetratricopeptide (TPR) repeat protein
LALEINPRDSQAFVNRGVARARLGDKKNAIADFNQAILINPLDSNTFYNRGIAYAELGNNQQAILDFSKSLEINPYDGDTFYNRGAIYLKSNQFAKAVEDFNRVLAINSDRIDARLYRGIARGNLGDKKGAIADLEIVARELRKVGNNLEADNVQKIIKEFDS